MGNIWQSTSWYSKEPNRLDCMFLVSNSPTVITVWSTNWSIVFNSLCSSNQTNSLVKFNIHIQDSHTWKGRTALRVPSFWGIHLLRSGFVELTALRSNSSGKCTEWSCFHGAFGTEAQTGQGQTRGHRLFTEEEGVHWKDEEKEGQWRWRWRCLQHMFVWCDLMRLTCVLSFYISPRIQMQYCLTVFVQDPQISPYLTNSGSPTTTKRESNRFMIFTTWMVDLLWDPCR